MKLFLTGGTGFVGSYFTRRFLEEGHEVTILTRSAGRGDEEKKGGVSWVQGDPTVAGPWQESLSGHDAVINLAGSTIFTPWTSKARKVIEDSRILTTRNLVDALEKTSGPVTLLSGSAVGYYGGRLDDAVITENTPPGDDFLARLGVKWEQEALRAETRGVRVAICRLGIVLGRDGGALSKMIPPFKRYMGSHLGSGKQWFPWIHMEDLFRIFLFLLEKPELKGPFNCTAPNPLTNKEFARVLAKALGTSVLMPGLPAVMIRMALGDFGEVVLKGQRAVPHRLLEEGFVFRFSRAEEALADLLK